MSRRIGQTGNVFQHCKQWNPEASVYGRYWVDTPAGRKRETITLGKCPSRTVARRKLWAHIERNGINSGAAFHEHTAPAVTFREQAETWIAALATRRRRPVKPATIFGWQHALDKWILPNLGDKLLADVSNGALRELVETMAAAGLSPKTIVNHALVVKLVVASAVTSDGEQIYPRKWNHDFIGLPIIEPSKQHRPSLTKAEIGELLAGSSSTRWAVLFALLGATGLRIGEALALRVTDFSPDCRVVSIQRSLWHGKEQAPKTPNAVRVVDIAEPLAACMRGYMAGRSGYVFSTAGGRPLGQRNALRALHATGKKIGFHAFRRFRTETLRRCRVPEDLIKFWLGHSKTTMTDLYASGLANDEAWRREWCEQAGLGFFCGLQGLQNSVTVDCVKAA